MSKQKVVVFGELLLRLDASGHQRLVQTDQLHVSFTGGEVNVAVALAQWGVPTSVVSAVPDHAMGQACINFLRQHGLNTEGILRTGERLGILYVESGAGQRGTSVIYDRNHTSFRSLQPDDLNWEDHLTTATHLHFTGTALVSPGSRQLLLTGLQEAKKRNITISFDVSYRSQLWSLHEAKVAFQQVIPFIDILLGSEQDATTFFDISETGDAALLELQQRHQIQKIAFTERLVNNLGVNQYSGTLCEDGEIFHSTSYETVAIDRIGTGDAFTAGILRSCEETLSPQDVVEFATAAAVLKHTIPGDFALLSVDEINALVSGTGIGRIKR